MGNKNIPEIRFKGFSDPWEQRKLGEMGNITTGKAFSSKEFNQIGEYLVITNKDISDSSRSQNVLPDRINVSDKKLISKYNLSGNNILVTMDGVNLGKTAKFSNNKALLAQRVGRIQSDQLEFIYQLTASSVFLLTMRTLSVGNAIKHISLQQISDYTSYVPNRKEEQQKIGAFFEQLDNAITLHQRKLDKLKCLKKSYLQKMFPRNGETKPELRFDGFKDAWEQRKLGDMLKNAYQGINTAGDKVEYSDGGIEILQSKHITSGVISFEEARMLNKEEYPEYFPKYVPTIGDILFANIGTIGPSIVVTTSKEFLVAWNILKMTPQNAKSSKFIQLLLQKLNSRHFFDKITTGNATKFVNKDAMLGIDLLVPSIYEQSKISELFLILDNTITLHQRKLDKLKLLKKFYLQKMFV